MTVLNPSDEPTTGPPPGPAGASMSSADPFWHEMKDEPIPEKPKVKQAYISSSSDLNGKASFVIEIKDDEGKVLTKSTLKSVGYTAPSKDEARREVIKLRKDLEDGIHWL